MWLTLKMVKRKKSTHIRISKKLKKKIERKKGKNDSFSDFLNRRIK